MSSDVLMYFYNVLCVTSSSQFVDNMSNRSMYTYNVYITYVIAIVMQFFIIYSQILLIVSDIHNHSIHYELVYMLPDFATVLYDIVRVFSYCVVLSC